MNPSHNQFPCRANDTSQLAARSFIAVFILILLSACEPWGPRDNPFDPEATPSPAKGESVNSSTPLLDWGDFTGANGYQLRLAASSAELSAAAAIDVQESQYQVTDTLSGEWCWQVRVFSAEGSWSEWSVEWTFIAPISVGSTGPAGGIVFYDKGKSSDGWRYLEAAPSDQSSGIQWYNGSYMTTGATATGIGKGETNTATIVSKQGTGSYAASLCYNLVLGGYDDWFLPSKNELNEMYKQKAIIGGFSSSLYSLYWSSSEDSSGTAWTQYFDIGIQYSRYRDYYERVRAVRAF